LEIAQRFGAKSFELCALYGFSDPVGLVQLKVSVVDEFDFERRSVIRANEHTFALDFFECITGVQLRKLIQLSFSILVLAVCLREKLLNSAFVNTWMQEERKRGHERIRVESVRIQRVLPCSGGIHRFFHHAVAGSLKLAVDFLHVFDEQL
jgi:hypothetical protein